jgi:hypothetical protein
MLGIFLSLSKFYLQADQPWDIPGIEDKPQEFVDEDQINETFEPANDVFSGLREAGDWLIQTISDIFSQLFGNLM